MAKLILVIIAFLTNALYLIWRIGWTIPWEDSTLAWVFGLLLWIAELISAFSAFILLINRLKPVHLEEPELENPEYPHVDVLIATHNEPASLVYHTVNACLRMDYPDPSKVHIYICDDTNRPEMAQLARDFGVGYLGLEENKHAKSGNLNHALSKTNSPLIATFDADMIPYASFLMKTVPYFLSQEEKYQEIGLIQTPQSFYNADIFQYHFYSEASVPNEQDFFSKSVNVINNRHGAAVYTGSNTLLRRQAVEEAGGFPIKTITEDFELGVRMNLAGYKNYSIQEAQAAGLTPTDLRTVLKQRIRWGRGVIRSSYNTNIFLNPKLTMGQRLIYINGYLYWSSFFRRLLYIVAPILYTVGHMRIVKANVWLLLIFWLPGYLLGKWAQRDLTDHYRTQTWGEIVETLFAPYLVIPQFLEGIGLSEKKFKVTPKSHQGKGFDWVLSLPYLILWGLSLYGLITFNLGKFGMELFYGSVISFWLIHHLINLTFAIFATLERPIHRQEERFFRQEPAWIHYQDQVLEVQVKDFSLSGMSFSTSEPLYLPPLLNIEVKTGQESLWLEGELVRSLKAGKQWIYGVKLAPQSEALKRDYSYHVLAQPNAYLTTYRDSWATIWDDLAINLKQRLRNWLRPQAATTAAVIATHYPFQADQKDLVMTQYGLSQVKVAFQEDPPSNHLGLDLPGAKLNLIQGQEDKSAKVVTYQVESVDIQDWTLFNQQLASWAREGGWA